MENPQTFTVKLYPHWKKRFFTIWSGQAISMLGSSIISFAVVWYLTEQTGSATILAIASLFSVLPGVILSPFAGAFVDRGNRRSIMIFSDLLIGLTRLLAVVLFLSGSIVVWHIYLINFIASAAGAFQHPAMASSTSLMVPKRHLSRVAGMNQTLHGALNIAGPPLGALLLSLTSIANIFLLDFLTMLIAVLPLLFIPIPNPETRKDVQGNLIKRSFRADLIEGFRYIISWRGLTLILLSAMLINFLLAPALSLLPLLVSKHFGGDEVQLAVIDSAFGIGMLVGGLVLSVWGGFKRRILTSFMGLVISGFALSTIFFIPSNGFYFGVAAFTLAALMLPLINGPIHAVIQSVVAPEMQGRVIAMMSTTTQLAVPIGLAIAGPVSDALGIQTWFLIGGIVMSLVGACGFIVPAMREIEEQSQPAPDPANLNLDTEPAMTLPAE